MRRSVAFRRRLPLSPSCLPDYRHDERRLADGRPAASGLPTVYPLFYPGNQSGQGANTAAAAIKDVATDAIVKLGEAVSRLSDVLRSTLDLIATLGGKLPPLDDAAMTVIEEHLVQVLNAGSDWLKRHMRRRKTGLSKSAGV